jgi:hypothetical protein
VGVTAGSREVPGRKPVTRDHNDNDYDTDRTVPNHKTDIIIRDNKKMNIYVNIFCSSWIHMCSTKKPRIF